MRRAVHDLVVGVVEVSVVRAFTSLMRDWTEPALARSFLRPRPATTLEILKLSWMLPDRTRLRGKTARRRHDSCVDDLVDEALRVEDHLLLMIRVRPPSSSAEISCHKRPSALRRRLGHHGSFADLQIIDFGEQVVGESGSHIAPFGYR